MKYSLMLFIIDILLKLSVFLHYKTVSLIQNIIILNQHYCSTILFIDNKFEHYESTSNFKY